jgi:hypothetical protein
MKRILLILMMMISGISLSQLSTTNPDTVCYQSTTLSTYTVPSIGSGTYTWTVTSPGVITAGQGTNSISVNWSAASPGLITNGVSVTYTSPAPANCPATPVNLNVLIYQVTPTITAIGPFCESDPCVTLVGTPSGGIWSGTGVVGNQFCPDNVTNGTNATSTVTYTVGSAGCTFSTSVVVPVYGTPTLSPIQHN